VSAPMGGEEEILRSTRIMNIHGKITSRPKKKGRSKHFGFLKGTSRYQKEKMGEEVPSTGRGGQ